MNGELKAQITFPSNFFKCPNFLPVFSNSSKLFLMAENKNKKYIYIHISVVSTVTEFEFGTAMGSSVYIGTNTEFKYAVGIRLACASTQSVGSV